jgi:hypothetical protein
MCTNAQCDPAEVGGYGLRAAVACPHPFGKRTRGAVIVALAVVWPSGGVLTGGDVASRPGT